VLVLALEHADAVCMFCGMHYSCADLIPPVSQASSFSKHLDALMNSLHCKERHFRTEALRHAQHVHMDLETSLLPAPSHFIMDCATAPDGGSLKRVSTVMQLTSGVGAESPAHSKVL